MNELPMTLFVIVDFQNDFVSGTLAVPDAEDTIDAIIRTGNAVIEAGGQVVRTRDWHPADHCSFAEGEPSYTDGDWPPHCVQDTWGGEFHPRIAEAFPDAMVFSKGQNQDEEQYSGFLATNEDGVTLADYARHINAEEVLTAGLALDYCVRATTFDFWTSGWFTTLVIDGTRPVGFETGARVLLEIGHYDQGELKVMESVDAVDWVLGP
jgi:nicotinamidase/pyrazinamidase